MEYRLSKALQQEALSRWEERGRAEAVDGDSISRDLTIGAGAADNNVVSKDLTIIAGAGSANDSGVSLDLAIVEGAGAVDNDGVSRDLTVPSLSDGTAPQII